MPSTKSIDRVVIYRLGSLGDTVVALPCFHKVAHIWPKAERIVLTNFPVSSKAAPLEVILRNGGLIDKAIAYPVGTRSLAQLVRLIMQLRGLHCDTLVYLTPARGLASAWRDFLFFKLAGFRRIIGIPLNQDLQRCRETRENASSEAKEERECERLVRCLRELGPIDLNDPSVWDLNLTHAELRVAADLLVPLGSKPVLAINMGGKAQEKDWGLDNWLALVQRLRKDYPTIGLLFVGAADDMFRAEEIAKSWGGPFVNACGRLSPRESAAAMRNAFAFVGHDSGPLHLAAASSVPCVGIFGNFNRPARWHPWGSRHRILHCMEGLQHISVDEVICALSEISKENDFLQRAGTIAKIAAPSEVR